MKAKTLLKNILPDNKEKGVSLLYVVLITSVLLAISFGISRILISQIKMLGQTGYSIVAFYAADSGIERFLADWSNPNPVDLSGTLSNNASYEVSVVKGGIGTCPSEFNYCIRSVGSFKGVKRAIQISY